MTKPKLALSGPWSSGALIVAVAVFVTLFLNIPFFRSALATYGGAGDRTPFLISLVFYMGSLFVLVLSAVCHRALVKPLLIGFLLLSSVIGYFTLTYGTIFDHHMIRNVLETDTGEAGDLYNNKLVLYIAFLGLLPSYLVYRAELANPGWKAETISRLKLAAAAGAVQVVIWVTFSAHYASLMREHRDLAGLINPTYALRSAIKLTSQKLKSNGYPHVVVGADAHTRPTDQHRELVIMVVGETARGDHWQLNGYERETSPMMKQLGVINFPDFWSCDTSTAKSVPCMFSNLGRANFSVERAKAADNALDVLKRAGVSVLWRDNNSSSKGVADKVTYEDFSTPKTNPICDIECRDEGMLAGLQEYIDKQPGDVMIVLHQMGNHGPAYYKRYPKEFEHFTPVCQTNDLGSCSSEQINNAFDNALRYTDHFLSKTIELLKRNDGKYETAMFYVSDHGESLGEFGLYLHATPYMIAPDAQKHVPAVLWLGESIKHDLKLGDIEERRKRRWSHDNVFSTLLGLFEVHTNAYKPELDLLEHSDTELSAAEARNAIP